MVETKYFITPINSSVTLATFKNHLRKVDFENLVRTDPFSLH